MIEIRLKCCKCESWVYIHIETHGERIMATCRVCLAAYHLEVRPQPPSSTWPENDWTAVP